MLMKVKISCVEYLFPYKYHKYEGLTFLADLSSISTIKFFKKRHLVWESKKLLPRLLKKYEIVAHHKPLMVQRVKIESVTKFIHILYKLCDISTLTVLHKSLKTDFTIDFIVMSTIFYAKNLVCDSLELPSLLGYTSCSCITPASQLGTCTEFYQIKLK